jgi:2-polyprenyl-3-methyl-5-hydroxy-6-metoxy-1,4-benzoquinol methylase
MMTNTEESFADKWNHNPRLAFDETLREGSSILQWILSRNGFADVQGLARHLRDRRRILDAGCGNGRITALLRAHTSTDAEIVAIDLVSAHVTAANLAGAANVRVEQRNLLDDLSDLGTFDFIYCQEVLHHTGNPAAAFANLAGRLSPGGEIAIYVYKVKAPCREFTDDYVRARIAKLPYAEALAVCGEITAFGKALSEHAGKVRVPAVPILGIEAGEYDVQRLIYHFFAKCFWNDELRFDDNVVVNYDWYHPQDCTRHTVEEVRDWFAQAGLQIVHETVDHYGITVRGRQPEHARSAVQD